MTKEKAVVRARIDGDLKAEAERVLANLGLTLSDAFRMTVTRIAKDGQMPFELKVPNAATAAAIRQSRAKIKDRRAVDEKGVA